MPNVNGNCTYTSRIVIDHSPVIVFVHRFRQSIHPCQVPKTGDDEHRFSTETLLLARLVLQADVENEQLARRTADREMSLCTNARGEPAMGFTSPSLHFPVPWALSTHLSSLPNCDHSSLHSNVFFRTSMSVENDRRSHRFLANGLRRRIEQRRDATNESRAFLRIVLRNFVNLSADDQ